MSLIMRRKDVKKRHSSSMSPFMLIFWSLFIFALLFLVFSIQSSSLFITPI